MSAACGFVRGEEGFLGVGASSGLGRPRGGRGRVERGCGGGPPRGASARSAASISRQRNRRGPRPSQGRSRRRRWPKASLDADAALGDPGVAGIAGFCALWRGLGLRACGFSEKNAVSVVAADAARPMEDGERAVGIDVDLDPRLDEVRPHRAFRDLQLQRAVGDAIVVADLALLLDAQDLVEIDAQEWA